MALTRPRLQATLACAGTLVLWRWRGGPGPAALAGLAAALALVAWVAPARYAPVQRALDRGLHWLLAALTWTLLAVVYLLVFTPWHAMRRLARRDVLRRRPDPAAASYLQPLPPGQGNFDRQF
jgi:hypothetical protein